MAGSAGATLHDAPRPPAAARRPNRGGQCLPATCGGYDAAPAAPPRGAATAAREAAAIFGAGATFSLLPPQPAPPAPPPQCPPPCPPPHQRPGHPPRSATATITTAAAAVAAVAAASTTTTATTTATLPPVATEAIAISYRAICFHQVCIVSKDHPHVPGIPQSGGIGWSGGGAGDSIGFQARAAAQCSGMGGV